MVDAQTISIVFAGVSIGLAAIYYAMNIRNQRETRQAQLFMSIYNQWRDLRLTEIENEFLSYEFTDIDDFLAKYGIEGWNKIEMIERTYEGLGVLVHRNLIDVNMVDDLLSVSIIRLWEKGESLIKEYRTRTNTPQSGEFTEYLYNRIKAIVEKQHPELKT